MDKINKNIKSKIKNIIVTLFVLIFLVILIISVYNIIKWKLDSNKITNELNSIQKQVTIDDISDTIDTEIIKQEIDISKEDPYWDYIKMNMIDVNFTDLKKINSDVKGWIKVSGTNINYPFVQANNNEYYLTHTFNKSYNSAGWVFLDYRNNGINDKNTIIYAHGRFDKTMFGSLKNILSSGWLNDSNNYVVKISTETENTLWQVFSVYHIPTTSDYIKVNFSSSEEFKNWISMLINRSAYNFNTSVNENDNILTLSTCYNKTDKVVLHAKLIKREKK